MLLILWGLAWLSAFALTGAFDMHWWQPGVLWVAPVGLAAGGTGGDWRTGARRAAAALVAVLFALCGGARAAAFLARPPPSLINFVGRDVTAFGTVDSEPRRGLTTARYPVSVDYVEVGGESRPVHGRLLVAVGEYTLLPPGTGVRLEGRIERPPALEDFDYAGHLLKQGIVGTMYRPGLAVTVPARRADPRRLLARLRDAIDLALARSLPEPEAALAAGLLIGRDDALPDDLTEAFRSTGLAHLVAVSGANVVVLTAILFALVSPLIGRRRALLPALASIVFYVFLAGAAWSIVRAAIMASLYLLGEYTGRPRSGLSALAAAAVAITAVRPGAAFEAGFQLSVAATGGLVTLGPWARFLFLRALGARGRAFVPRTLTEVAALTVSATLATLPVSWATFGTVSLISPLANVAVEPLFAAAFAGSGVVAEVCPDLVYGSREEVTRRPWMRPR